MQYELSSDLAIRTMEDEVFVFDRKSSTLHTFNSTGAVLWRALQDEVPAESLAAALVKEFEIDTAQAQDDVEEFLNTLEQAGMLRLRKEG